MYLHSNYIKLQCNTSVECMNVTSSLCQPCSSNPCWRPTGDSGEVPRESAYLQAVERFHALLPQLRLEEPLPLLIAFMFGKKKRRFAGGCCWFLLRVCWWHIIALFSLEPLLFSFVLVCECSMSLFIDTNPLNK